MSIDRLIHDIQPHATVGSILHGAYGDYYEQMICLREIKRRRPDLSLVLFFATELRRRELEIFDLSFAQASYGADRLADVSIDRFIQFQVRDLELIQNILAKLPERVLSRIDCKTKLKPWTYLRGIFRSNPMHCNIGLSDVGKRRLPECYRDNGLTDKVFDRPTIGFLWRYRRLGGAISPRFQPSREILLHTKSQLLTHLSETLGATIIVAGMNVQTTAENRERTDNKFASERLDLPASAIYLRGLSWGLELEIMARCSLSVVMASGFSEALFMKAPEKVALLDPPIMYLAKLLFNRMPLHSPFKPSNLWFYLRQPHTSTKVVRFLKRQNMLSLSRFPAIPNVPAARSPSSHVADFATQK